MVKDRSRKLDDGLTEVLLFVLFCLLVFYLNIIFVYFTYQPVSCPSSLSTLSSHLPPPRLLLLHLRSGKDRPPIGLHKA